jgi:cysteinyl-tRNA synthetase
MIKLYNTLSRRKETFKSIKPGKVSFYACGPTVYWYAHIGNMRSYIFEDILKRTFEYNNYKVNHVINITDVGHLTSDADTGEDKMEKAAKRDKKSAWEIANYYTDHFKKDIDSLNIKKPSSWVKATDYIEEQIKLIKKIEKSGFAYKTNDGIYFDTSKIKNYTVLWGSKKINLKPGIRVKKIKEKKNITDFALWKLSPSNSKREMEWDSPWGKGFPGWHTECVAMAAKKLGIPFDVHCGGIDHIQIHHTNEIAQSISVYGKIPANFWLHGEFLNINNDKMAKSKKEIIRVSTLEERGFDPLAYRYLCLGAHYRSKLSFSWESMASAQKGFNSLKGLFLKLKDGKVSENKIQKEKKKFKDIINNDLDTPKALAFTRKTLKNKNLSDAEKKILIHDFNDVLGLEFKKNQTIPNKIMNLAKKRDLLRKNKEWQKADKLREAIENMGYKIEDLNNETIIKK